MNGVDTLKKISAVNSNNLFGKTQIAFLVVLLLVMGCKKPVKPPLSSDKQITIFTFDAVSNPALQNVNFFGVFQYDTIRVQLGHGIPVTNLVPSIAFTGKSISPLIGTAQDFTNPVKYTVTAEDGSTATYTVIVTNFTGLKSITSFVLTVANNPGVLTNDITGFIHNDTIEVAVPPGTPLNSLVPDITNSKTGILYPQNKTSQDFTSPAVYTVTADDQSSISYKVFVGSNKYVYFGSTDSCIYALNGITGALRWKYKTLGPVSTTPTISNGMVIAGSQDNSVYALDTASGKLVWKHSFWGSINVTPAAANGVIYVSSSSEPANVPPYYNQYYLPSTFHAIDASTGNELWNHTAYAYETYLAPTVSNGIVLVDKYGGNMEAYDATNGQVKWESNVGLGGSNPAVNDASVFTSAELIMVQAKNITTGANTWAFAGSSSFAEITNPTINNGVLYTDGFDGFYAFDLATNTVKWKAANMKNKIPVVNNGVLYLTDASGSTLSITDCNTGAVKGTLTIHPADPTFQTFVTGPFVVNGTIYETDSQGYFYAFNNVTGIPKWRFLTGAKIQSPAVVVDSKGNVIHPGNSGEQN